MSEEPLTETQKAHAWQGHRRDCVELAIRSGGTTYVTGDQLIELADKISSFIMNGAQKDDGQSAA